MKKSIFIFILALLSAITGKADITADWKIHMPFDDWPTQVVETPERVYFMSRTYEDSRSVAERSAASHSLFYYDKGGNEIIPMNARVNTSSNAVACIGYNAEKEYLLVVYTDGDIDFIYDNGRTFNVPALKTASTSGRKTANHITFDHRNNLAYIATNFGYLALNDNKHEVAESRIYNENVQSVARCGKNIVLCIDGKVYYAPASEQRFKVDEYLTIDSIPEITTIIPLNVDHFYGYKNSYDSHIGIFRAQEDGSFEWEQYYSDPQFFGIQEIKGGHRLTGNVRIYKIDNGSALSFQARPNEAYGIPAATYSGNEVWTLTGRKGLRSYKVNGDWDWSLTRDYMRPNAPATYVSTYAIYHPSYGVMAGSNGTDIALSDFNQRTPSNISALKGGFWKEFGPDYANPGAFKSTNNYTGLAIDPNNTNHLYRGSTLGGLMRVNLANPSDIMIFANPSNENASSPGFVTVADDLSSWNRLCRFTTPRFTTDGTMWTLYNNADESQAELWYWGAADRASTTSAANYRKMKKIGIPKFTSSNSDVMITLRKNPNMVVIGGSASGGTFIIYDHNGTPDATNDDRYVYMTTPYDQDGGMVNFLAVNNLAEDPETGIVYIMSQRGLFTVNPATAFDNPNSVNRIKVARNDGTNLADYLLNEINVNDLSIDGEGRKWFSTSNGLVCTSRDCRTILGEFTTDNSYLPDNNIYTTYYNPENSSMLVATGAGIVEMFPSGSGNSGSDSNSGVRAYPNPVEPDFYGYVRIDNIADGSLVKIADSRGSIVRELGPVSGGSIDWDISGYNNARVTSGVYYIMVSPGSGGGASQILKILVLN